MREMTHAVDQAEAGDPLGVMHGELGRDRAAEREGDDRHPAVDAERVQQVDDLLFEQVLVVFD
ncbi:hypothetical protein SAMN05421874_109105 [Nonomuraea maritima]|uniref:Uncharacterized protein n=1 Tax=Nonomuraea maritima TaxID=683260 RepID=A0A1G9DEM2_9ACTN|nr:hypothetical protein [Nonomuraea maritima]SDK62325.1 hypothetical protein SAMN05421874_109105 [Nonomuraea maritima]